MLRKSNLVGALPLVCLITGGEATSENFESKSLEILKLIESAIIAKLPLIQIREKKLSAKLLFEIAQRATNITKGTETKLLINGRTDIAYLSGADGVHLPTDSIPREAIRESFRDKLIIGVSAHSLLEAKAAEASGADYVIFGPVFYTPSKEKFGDPQGLDKLKEVSQNLSIPLIAIGGIDDSNYESVLQNGAAGFAAIRFLGDAEKLVAIAHNVRASFGQ